MEPYNIRITLLVVSFMVLVRRRNAVYRSRRPWVLSIDYDGSLSKKKVKKKKRAEKVNPTRYSYAGIDLWADI